MRYQTKTRNTRNQTSIYTDVKSNSINFIYDDCDNSRVNWKANRVTKREWDRSKYDTDYIDFDADRSQSSAEPLYISILPPAH